MAILDQNVINVLRPKLNEIEDIVELELFIDEEGTPLEQLLKEVVELTDKLKLNIHKKGDELEKMYKVHEYPTVAVKAKNKGLVKFLGIPSGHEFFPFIQTIIEASKGDVDLPPELKDQISSIDKPTHLMVFVTPTCPYCPNMVRLAHIMAILNENIDGEGIEAMEFRDLSIKFNVSGVPKTVVNSKHEFVGMMPPEAAINEIKKALQ